MKKLIAVLLVLSSTAASAQHYGYHHGYHREGWVAPLVIGGALGYIIARPAPIIVQQPPVVVSPQPSVIVQNPVPIFQEVIEYDQGCACYVKTYKQIGWR
jgi:hypothetical protein